jgi:NlpC/P60 family
VKQPLLGLVSMILLAPPLVAQDGGFLYAGKVLAGTSTETSWRVTAQKDLTGPLGIDGSFLILPGARPADGELYGVGGDFTLLSAERGVPTVFAGLAGGIGLGGQQRLWGAISFGVRMPVLILGSVRLMAEGRYRSYTFDGRTGVEVGLALGFRTHRHDLEMQPEGAGLFVLPPIAEILRARGIPEEKARLLANVVKTAVDEMGQPYVWGGTGNGNGGFDCSGLIQYAYSRYGIAIPRTSAGQAAAGIAIRRDQEALLPGDILVFSDRGDEPTHVGLYVGEGKFIHSASKGVRISRLADDDTEGRLWLRRWIGVRRIVE